MTGRLYPAFVTEHSHGAELVEPTTDTQKTLAKIWQKLLSVDEIGIHDDFFMLGGHSLLTIKLLREIDRKTGQQLTIASVFENPTIERLARIMEASPSEVRKPGSRTIMPIRESGSEPPLFCIDGEPMRMATSLSKERPLYGLYHAYDPDFVPPDSIPELAAIYLREMRKVQPSGPYHIVGFCIGGLVAYEMASQLQETGEEMAYLGLIDPTIPGSRGESRVDWVRSSFSVKGRRAAAAWFFFKRAFASVYARMGLGQRWLRGKLYKALGLELPLRLRHIQNQGRIRKSHKNYRYHEADLKAHVFLQDVLPEHWDYYKKFWGSVFKGGVELERIKGLTSHPEFLVEPHISNVTRTIDQDLSQLTETPNDKQVNDASGDE